MSEAAADAVFVRKQRHKLINEGVAIVLGQPRVGFNREVRVDLSTRRVLMISRPFP